MFKVANNMLMSPDTQRSLKMLYQRQFEPQLARKVLKLVTEADKNFQRLTLSFQEKSPEQIADILKEDSQLDCEKLEESEVLYNHPISAEFINGITSFIN